MNAKDKRRDYQLRRLYGITLDQYNEILRKQGGCCGICERPAATFKRSLAVDHCHKTLRVRGLLCPWCNRGLRYYGDNPEAMERAGQYLRGGTDFYAPPKKRKRKTKGKTNKSRKRKAKASRKGKR